MKRVLCWPLIPALMIACSLLLLTGCGASPTQTLSPVSTPTGIDTATVDVEGSGQVLETATPVRPEDTRTPKPTEIENTTMDESLGPQAASLIEQAKEDLGSRLEIEADQITLEMVEAVQWRDSSLGCPGPGANYLTVITPGYQIILSVAGQNYDYRTDLKRALLCER